jgi:hypothetical protein
LPAVLIINLSSKVSGYKIKHKKITSSLPIIFISAIVIFGFSNNTATIVANDNSPYFEALSFIVQYLQGAENKGNGGIQAVSMYDIKSILFMDT